MRLVNVRNLQDERVRPLPLASQWSQNKRVYRSLLFSPVILWVGLRFSCPMAFGSVIADSLHTRTRSSAKSFRSGFLGTASSRSESTRTASFPAHPRRGGNAQADKYRRLRCFKTEKDGGGGGIRTPVRNGATTVSTCVVSVYVSLFLLSRDELQKKPVTC